MATSRSRVADVSFTYEGLTVQRVPNPTITVYLAGTTTPYPGAIWKNATGVTGADQYSNPFTGDASGAFELYLDSPPDLKVVATGIMPSGLVVGPLTADNLRPIPPLSDLATGSKDGSVWLLDYAGGVNIAGGTISASFAFDAADAACLALSRKTIVVPPGTFLTKYSPTTGTTIEGAGKGKTILKHQNGNLNGAYRLPIINCIGKTDVTLRGISFDGNYTQNNDATNGYTSSEVALDGNRCRMIDCEVYDFNAIGVTYGATDVTIENCDAYRNSPPSTYPITPPYTGGSANYGGFYGFMTPGNTQPVRVRLLNCRAWNLRSAGVIIGGPDFRVDNFVGWELHRGPFPYDGGSVSTPGGCIATTPTWNGGGVAGIYGTPAGNPANWTVRPTGVITAPQLGPTAVGVYAQGLELSLCDRVTVVGPNIKGMPSIGIKFSYATDCVIMGGVIDGANPGGTAGVYGVYGVYGVNADNSPGGDSLRCHVIGTTIKNHTSRGAIIGNACDYFKFMGCTWDNPAGQNWEYTSTGTHLDSLGHRVIAGGAVPEQTSQALAINAGVVAGASGLTSFTRNVTAEFAASVQQFHATGHAFQVVAQGSSASQVVARFLANAGANVAMDVLADGTALHRAQSGAANILTLDTLNAAGVNPYLTLQRSGTPKAQIGLDASDSLSMLSAAGAALLTVDKTSGALSGPTFNWTSLGAWSFEQPAGIAVGSTASSTDYIRFCVIGKICYINFHVSITTAGSAGVINFKHNVSALNSRNVGLIAAIGTGTMYDASAVAFYQGTWVATSAGTYQMLINGAGGNYAGVAPVAWQLASGDQISGMLEYELA